MISVPLLVTDAHHCSYLPQQSAQTAFVHPSFTINNEVYSKLIQQGYRRSGDEIYAPYCHHCRQCVPVRIPVAEFVLNRQQKRCLKKNQAVESVIKPPQFLPDHYKLYLRYQTDRHQGGSMAKSTAEEYISFLTSHWSNTWFIEFSLYEQLVAVAIVDYLDNALSAVYTFFDPAYATISPGTYAILWQIDYAKKLDLSYVYLGYWIRDCRKMNYKSQFKPLDGFFDHEWRRMS